MEKRVIFPKTKQKEFLRTSKNDLNISWREFSKKIGINNGTLVGAYKYEYCSLPYQVFLKILKLRKINKKTTLKNFDAEVVNFDRLLIIGRKCLGERRINLKKETAVFNKPIPKLDTSYIQFTSSGRNKYIKFPDRLSPDLAEEIGMHIGDGFLSAKKYEYRLKGNKDEKEYYDCFIKPLYKKLYNIEINLKEYETTYGFELYSKSLWQFKNKVLGIPAGRKNSIALPEIIKVNDKPILIAFIRGLFDTDGYISFISKYGYKNYYPTIGLTMLSKCLIDGVSDILYMLGLEPYKYKDTKGYWTIRLNGYERLERYYKLIGWNNPKHLKKVKNWKERYPELAKDIQF